MYIIVPLLRACLKTPCPVEYQPPSGCGFMKASRNTSAFLVAFISPRPPAGRQARCLTGFVTNEGFSTSSSETFQKKNPADGGVLRNVLEITARLQVRCRRLQSRGL